MYYKFEWDSRKAKINLNKHGVSFEEASTVFDDELSVTFPDVDHSTDEFREITIGYSVKGRLLLVFFVVRDNIIRIFSARLSTKKEKDSYEKES